MTSSVTHEARNAWIDLKYQKPVSLQLLKRSMSQKIPPHISYWNKVRPDREKTINDRALDFIEGYASEYEDLEKVLVSDAVSIAVGDLIIPRQAITLYESSNSASAIQTFFEMHNISPEYDPVQVATQIIYDLNQVPKWMTPEGLIKSLCKHSFKVQSALLV